jgi:hypothetical protein
MLAILYGLSVVLLIAAIFFWVRDGRRRVTNPARQLLMWLSLLALTAAVLLFVRFLWVVDSPEFLKLSLTERIDATTTLVRLGFRLGAAALLSCWVGTLKTTICVAISSGAICFLWALGAMV